MKQKGVSAILTNDGLGQNENGKCLIILPLHYNALVCELYETFLLSPSFLNLDQKEIYWLAE